VSIATVSELYILTRPQGSLLTSTSKVNSWARRLNCWYLESAVSIRYEREPELVPVTSWSDKELPEAVTP